MADFSQQGQPPDPKSITGFFQNLGASVKRFGQDIIHLPETAVPGVTALFEGMAEKSGFPPVAGVSHAPVVDQLVDAYKQRYGSWEGFKNSLYTDPVPILVDASALAGGVGAAARGIEAAATTGNVAKTAGAVARAAETAFAVTDPLQAGVKLAGAGARAAAPVVRKLSSEAGVLRLPDLSPWWSRQQTRWLDEFTPIKDLEGMAALPPTESAYQAARVYAGHFGKIVAKEGDLRKILRPVAADGLIPDLDRFLELERHKELFARPDIGAMYETPGNMTAAQVDSELASMANRLGPQRMSRIDAAAQGVRDWSNKTLAEYHDAGMISDEAYQTILEANHHYSPLQRTAYLADEAEKLPVGGRTFNVRSQPVVKQVFGSTQETLPATEAFLRNAYRMTGIAERNKVTSRLANMADRPEFAGVIRPLTGGAEAGPGEGVINTFRNGTKEAFAVPKPVADAVSGMSVRDMDTLTGWVRATNRILVEGSTRFNPPFIARNIWRDFQTATLRGSQLGGTGFTPLDWVKGFAQAIRRGDLYDQYLRSGAGMSGFFERQASVKSSLDRIIEPDWKRIGRKIMPWELMRLASETSELAPRLGYFGKALKRGFDPETAGMMTREATVDFSRMGTDMKKLNMWIPFLNARVQGTALELSAIKNNPIRSAAILSSTIGLPTYATYLHNVTEHPQVWDDIRDYEKWNNFIYIYGDNKDKEGNYTDVVKIPKGSVGRYFANPIENFLEWTRNAHPKALGELAMQEASDISPIEFAKEGKLSGWPILSGTLPPIVKAAIVEPAANRNLYTQTPIETEAMQKARPKERYNVETVSTSATPPWLVKSAQVLPDFLKISPRMLQNMILTQFGGAGRMVAGDVPPEREVSQERTGMGPMKRAFTGARGGGEEERRFQRAEPIAEDAATQDFIRKRNAEHLFVQMLNAPVGQRANMLRTSGMDLPTFMKFLDAVGRGAKEMTDYERYLSGQPSEARARILAQELSLAPDNRSRGLLLKRLNEIGVFTDDVAEKMSGLQIDGGQSPMEKAFGVKPAVPKELSPMEKALGVK